MLELDLIWLYLRWLQARWHLRHRAETGANALGISRL